MNEIKTLSIDLETKSSVDISKAGVYKYAQSPDFDILLFGVVGLQCFVRKNLYLTVASQKLSAVQRKKIS